MRKILGILGGLSWVSTQEYYRLINEEVNRRRGRQHSADLLVASVDFQEIVDAQVRGDWAKAGAVLAEKARGLELAGAGAFLIASNTMHLVFEAVQAAVASPGLAIFDAVAAAAKAGGHRRLGLLGTRYTMNNAFFNAAYASRDLEVLSPAPADAVKMNEIIFKELIHGRIRPESKAAYQQVVSKLASAGATAVILGCTEIPLLLRQEDCETPLLDTTALHASRAAEWLLS
jgi:aspartate racemase